MQRNGRASRNRILFSARYLGIVVVLALFVVFALPPQHVALGQSATGQETVLDVKFRAGRMRIRNGIPVDVNQPSPPDAQTSAQLSRLGAWERTHTVDEQTLEQLRIHAEWASGKPVPDLNLYLRVTVPAGADPDQTIRELEQLPNVEAVYLAPKPALLPTAPDYSIFSTGASTPYQQYLDAAPQGIGARVVRSLNGATAAGITVCDVEYSWNMSHTDFPTVTLYGSAPIDPFANQIPNSDNHGTAVLGVLGSKNDGAGSTGIAYGAALAVAGAYTASGYNVGAAITQCASKLKPGDVLLIEQQMYGPNNSSYVPVEWYKPTYDAIKLAVASGIVVVEAAGNGSESLDAPIYSTGNGGHYPFLRANDSGAILVGAGKSPFHDVNAREAEVFSNYGSRLDLQGWGDSVLTTGYGDLYASEGKNSWYTSSFNGTSSASPIVASAAALVQSEYKTRFGAPASPAQVRSLLRDTGTPQAGTKNIGPLPNLRCAFDSVLPLRLLAPASAQIGSSMPLTATVTAPNLTQPITYTWQIDNATPVVVEGNTSNVRNVAWNRLGARTVRIEARTGCGLPVIRTATVNVTGIAPTSATVDGVFRVIRGATETYTAAVAPLTLTQPVTYTWQADNQIPVTHTASTSDTATFTWNTAGSYTLTTTIDNSWGLPVVVKKHVEVGIPIATATITASGEANIGMSSSYTVAVEPAHATTPITYTWQLDDQAPIIRSGTASDVLKIAWKRTGAHTLKVTVTNGWGTPIVLQQTVNVQQKIFFPYLLGLKR